MPRTTVRGSSSGRTSGITSASRSPQTFIAASPVLTPTSSSAKAAQLAVSKGLEIKDGSTHLRLERRGNEVRAAFGPDGVRWTWFAPLTVDFDDRLSVGIAAINSATKPLNAGLEMFSITKRSQAGDPEHEGTDKPRRPGDPAIALNVGLKRELSCVSIGSMSSFCEGELP